MLPVPLPPPELHVISSTNTPLLCSISCQTSISVTVVSGVVFRPAVAIREMPTWSASPVVVGGVGQLTGWATQLPSAAMAATPTSAECSPALRPQRKNPALMIEKRRKKKRPPTSANSPSPCPDLVRLDFVRFAWRSRPGAMNGSSQRPNHAIASPQIRDRDLSEPSGNAQSRNSCLSHQGERGHE